MPVSPRRRYRLAQFALLALFGLGMILQPVLAALGEAHERAFHAADQGQAAHVDAHAPSLAAAGTAGSEQNGTLHQLLHFAHCCAQSPAMRAGELAMLPAAPVDPAPFPFDDARPSGRSQNAPYRPPIRV